MTAKFFDSLLNNTYEFPDGATPDEIRAAIKPLHDRARQIVGAAGSALGWLGQTRVQPPRILQQLTTPKQGPATPAGLPAPQVPGAAQAPAMQAGPLPIRTPGLVVPTTQPAPSGIDQNTAAMMASPGVLPQQAAQTPGPVQQQNPYPNMDAGALNQIGNILKMMDPVQRFPKVDRATAAALGNNFQPYMQARRQDIQSQQQERRSQQEQALRERAMFMQQQRQEQERRDRLAYQQMLMDNNEREEQLALKRFEMEAARAAREEQRFQEEQRQNAMPQWKVDTNMGMAYALDPATGRVMTQPIPEMQAAMAHRAAGSGGGGAAGEEGGLSSAEMSLMMREGATPDLIRALASGAQLTPEHMAELDTLRWNKMESSRLEGWGNVFDRLVNDLGEDAARAEADRRFPQAQKPASVAARDRREAFSAAAAQRVVGQGGSPERAMLSAQAVNSLHTATDEQMQQLLAEGLVTEQDIAAVKLSRKIPSK